MSSSPAPDPIKRQSAQAITARKRQTNALPNAQAITMLTCYDASTAQWLDGEVDILLVGDSLAMTVLGHPDTLSVTMDEMLHHVKAVSRGSQKSLIVADLPFMSYHISVSQAIENAGRMIQEGHAQAVKLEGATPLVCAAIRRLSQMGIPVMGHLGFTPQSINTLGGYKIQGKRAAHALTLLQQAQALEAAGAFAIVLELMPSRVAGYISSQLKIPTIGIGAGAACDGQVLVIDDVLGRYPNLKPRFVRQYADFGAQTQAAARQWAHDVQNGTFPTQAESYPLAPEDWPLHWETRPEPLPEPH
ncbi:MAG: 3-methyl-2-oxobutanoate hydroxymethyltransferase [Vampirovibrionales bacterium]|nr:3-methyl-2-oxobutanoate hydroxymethyltransferase [Vampirovibrionales bacterium]